MRDIPKYPKIRHLGDTENASIFRTHTDEIIVQEKFDGANFRFWREGDEMCFGSRNVAHLHPDDNAWMEQVDYLRSIDPATLDRDLVYVGEAIKKHSIAYNWDELPPFIGFDVIHIDTGLPLSYSFAKEEFERLGLPFMHMVWIGSASDWLKENPEDYMEESAYRDGPPEGIVIKNYERLNEFRRPLFAKMVTAEFKEKNRAVFGPTKTKPLDTAKVVDMYATSARIRKQAHRLIEEEGKQLGRPLMGDLIKGTIRDILEEEIVNIWLDRSIKTLDFAALGKLVPPRCLDVLDRMMADKASGEE